MSKLLVPRRAAMSIPPAHSGFRRNSCKVIETLFSSIAGFALLGVFLASSATVARAGANILIVTGTDSPAISAGNTLNTELTTAGNTVTEVNTGVPGSLAGFTQIYDTRYDNHPAFTAGEMSQYLAFLNAAAGNTIFLMGENGSFNVRNTPINQFIALAGGGTIAAPAVTSSSSETVNPPFTGPNVISSITYAACGKVTSAGTGAFASSETGGGCAIYFNQNRLLNAPNGALVVVYDVNFIYSAPSGGSAVNEIPFRQNLEQFVASPPVGLPPTVVTAVSPNTGTSNGGASVTITGLNFTGATAVNFGGVAAASFMVNSSTTITAVSPNQAAGQVDITVTAPGGTSSTGSFDLFTVTQAQGPVPTPTLSAWAMIGLGLLLGGGGYVGLMKAVAGQAAA